MDRQFDEDAEEIAPLRRFLDHKVDEAFLARYGANGVGIGNRRIRDGSRKEELCLVFYVERGTKSGPREQAEVPNPFVFNDPATGAQHSVPTDVVESEIATMNGGGPALDAAHRQVPGGVSCMIEQTKSIPLNTSTLGGWAWDTVDQTVVVLANMHALGDDPSTVVFHPSPLEAPGTRTRFGQVKRGTFTVNDTIKVDCAIATPDDSARAVFEVLQIGPAIMATAKPHHHQAVEKMGFKTKLTHGRIDDLYFKGHINDLAGNRRFFTDCVAVESTTEHEWCDSADSGSLVFASEPLPGSTIKPVVALHFGEKRLGGQKVGIACRITRVFEALSLSTLPDGLLTRLVNDLHTEAHSGGEASAPATAARVAPHLVMERTHGMIRALRERFTDFPLGTRLLTIVDTHRTEVVALLIQDAEMRAAALRVLRSLFNDTATLDELVASRGRPHDEPIVRLLELMVPRSSDTLRGALAQFAEQLAAFTGDPLVLTRFDAALPSKPKAPARKPRKKPLK